MVVSEGLLSAEKKRLLSVKEKRAKWTLTSVVQRSESHCSGQNEKFWRA
jgi:hypothetical protein